MQECKVPRNRTVKAVIRCSPEHEFRLSLSSFPANTATDIISGYAIMQSRFLRPHCPLMHKPSLPSFHEPLKEHTYPPPT